MSDEEDVEYSEVDEEEEVEAIAEEENAAGEEGEKDDAKSVASSVTSSRLKQRDELAAADESTLTEGEKAMIAAKKRHEDEDAAKIQDYEERRRTEREREEEELRLLKEKQEQRRLQREEEERQLAEKRQREEERRVAEEEERRVRMEEDRKKKEEAKRQKQQAMGQSFAVAGAAGGRNFVVPERKEKEDKFGNIVQAKQEMGMTKEQQDAAKESFISAIMKSISLTDLLGLDLKNRIKELHQRICKLETDKFDLEKRQERQIYDLKELNERQRQMVRGGKDAKAKIDPSDASAKYPPKIALVSKYDRQIDRRNFKERRSVYETKGAYPCFPNVPPPLIPLEKRLNDAVHSREASGGGGRVAVATLYEEEEGEEVPVVQEPDAEEPKMEEPEVEEAEPKVADEEPKEAGPEEVKEEEEEEGDEEVDEEVYEEDE